MTRDELVSVIKKRIQDEHYLTDGCLENYIDYRDEGSVDDPEDFEDLANAYKEIDGGSVESAADQWFYGKSWSMDVEDYYNDEIEKTIQDVLDEYREQAEDDDDEETANAVDGIENDLNEDRYSVFEECGYYGVDPKAIEYFPEYVKVDIFLDPWVDLPYHTEEATVEYMEQKCSIICELLASGGVDLNQFVDALKSGDIDSLGKFGKSVAEDMYEGWTDVLMSLTACAKISLEDYCKLASGMATSVTIQPSCYLLGLYNPYDGGGTPLEIELSVPFTIPANRVNMQVDNGRKSSIGWTVGDVYGLGGDAFVEDGIIVN